MRFIISDCSRPVILDKDEGEISVPKQSVATQTDPIKVQKRIKSKKTKFCDHVKSYDKSYYSYYT